MRGFHSVDGYAGVSGRLGAKLRRKWVAAGLLRGNTVLIETVGVGQDESILCGLADCVVVMLVPGGRRHSEYEAGLMEWRYFRR